MNSFWIRVHNCSHENIDRDYFDSGVCGTPNCRWVEERCLDCGAYIMKCDCGFCNSISGWPQKRWGKRDGIY